MDIKERIKQVIENSGANHENLRDLFDAVRLCEDSEEKREWLLYIRKMCRGINDQRVYELMRLTYVLGAQDGIVSISFCPCFGSLPHGYTGMPLSVKNVSGFKNYCSVLENRIKKRGRFTLPRFYYM